MMCWYISRRNLRTTRLVPFAVLFCCVALLSALVFVLDATADAEIPDALGSIAGLVTDDQGAPLAGVEVHLYKRVPYPSPLRTTTTDADGAYLFSALAAGVYQVEYRDPTGMYAFQFYQEKNSFPLADEVTVAGNRRTGIDARLARGGSITGLITGTQTASLTSAWLRLFREESPGAWREFSYAQLETGGGPYHFGGLATGLYRLCVSASSIELLYEECYQNHSPASPIALATPISVTAGMTATGIDLILGDLVSQPTLAGIVSAPDGAPLAGIEVTLWREDEYGWRPYSPRLTLSNGSFRFSYLSQELRYSLAFADPTGDYAREFFNDAVDIEHATVIEFGAGLLRDNLNVTLAPAGRITGVVTIGGEVAPLQGSVSAARQPDDDPVTARWWAAIDPTTGEYNLGGLPSGVYHIFAGASWDFVSLSGYYGGVDWESATPVEVTAGETVAEINIDLGRFDGAITGTVTYLGTPQAGMKVTLAAVGPFSELDERYTVYTYTDAAGVYRLDGLAANAYFVRVSDPAGRYATTYYQAGIDTPWPTAVTIPADKLVPDIDVALTLAGVIQGRVLRYNGIPVPNVYVHTYVLRKEGWVFARLDPVLTDAQGYYTLPGLLPGRYRLYFIDLERYEWSEYYNSAPTLEQAQDLLVQPELTTLAGTSILGPDVILHLPIVGR